MAVLVLNDASVTINSIDLSDHIAQVTLSRSATEVDITAFGSTAKKVTGGLKETSITLSFHQDYAASEVEATIYPLIGTVTTVVVKPTSSAVGATNPSYTLECLVTEWSPVAGQVGNLSTVDVTWPGNGDITKATS